MDVTPEKLLLWSVLERAILDSMGLGIEACTNGIAWKRDARKWLSSAKEEEFSFVWVCLHLNISPKKIRDFLRDKNNTRFIGGRTILTSRYFEEETDWSRVPFKM